ncbi:unnamed protein product, partial [marine sediment metagenome]
MQESTICMYTFETRKDPTLKKLMEINQERCLDDNNCKYSLD